MPYQILVVDDDKEIARLTSSYLEKAGYTVLKAHTGEIALQTIRREKPDLLVLDLMLPDMDGWDITRIIRSDPNLHALPIIMLTARVEDTDKIVGLEMGADDYITKPFNPTEVVSRVKALLRRANLAQTPIQQVLKVGDLKLDKSERSLILQDNNIDLTPTEFDLLLVFMESPGYVFTRDELVEKSLGYTVEGLGRTLDSHIKNLRKKIEPDPSKPIYIETVYGVGYRMAKSPGKNK